MTPCWQEKGLITSEQLSLLHLGCWRLSVLMAAYMGPRFVSLHSNCQICLVPSNNVMLLEEFPEHKTNIWHVVFFLAQTDHLDSQILNNLRCGRSTNAQWSS